MTKKKTEPKTVVNIPAPRMKPLFVFYKGEVTSGGWTDGNVILENVPPISDTNVFAGVQNYLMKLYDMKKCTIISWQRLEEAVPGVIARFEKEDKNGKPL